MSVLLFVLLCSKKLFVTFVMCFLISNTRGTTKQMTLKIVLFVFILLEVLVQLYC